MFFMIEDVRRLVADDTVATGEGARKLNNVRHDHRSVSLYGGMTDLPLIVERPEGQQWFSDRELIGHRLWAEHDVALRGETDRMSRELRENLLGDDIWSRLEHGTRAFLATAEASFRTHRQDPSYGSVVPHQTLGVINNLLEHNEDVQRGVRAAFNATDNKFLLGEAIHHLKPIADLRNPAAHSARITRAEASKLREQVLGIGQDGLICRIARLKI